MWKVPASLTTATLLCVALILGQVVATEPQTEDQPKLSAQAAEENLEDLIKSMEANGILLPSNELKYLPELIQQEEFRRYFSPGESTYERKRSRPYWQRMLDQTRPPSSKRNAELINSLLGLPRIMKVAGKK